MAPAILLVDDQRDILLLLRSALDTLRIPELEILEAASGQQALQALGEHPFDLLVCDYNPPVLDGMGLMHQARLTRPELRVILITGSADRKVRDQMLKAGALAVFRKPVPLGDFLDAVERALGLARTVLPVESAEGDAPTRLRVAELLENFRQIADADAVLLINNRGQVADRAGDLRDASMEVSLISGITATFNAGLKVAASNRQETPDQFSVFAGGDQDLMLMPVDPLYTLVVAGQAISGGEGLPDRLQALRELRDEVAGSLRLAGTTRASNAAARRSGSETKPAVELDSVLDNAAESGMTQEELDAYWDTAASKHSGQPLNGDTISYEQARKLGLTPDSKED